MERNPLSNSLIIFQILFAHPPIQQQLNRVEYLSLLCLTLILFYYFLNQISPMDMRCKTSCNVLFLSELYTCKDPNCFSPPIRCKDCFRFFHTTVDDNGLKKVHAHDKFDESIQYRNFLNLIKLAEFIERRVRKNFGAYIDNTGYFAWNIFICGSEFQSAFGNEQQINQFAQFRQIYYKKESNFHQSPSSDFSASLALFNEKAYNNAIERVTAPSYSELVLQSSINLSFGNKTGEVEGFIEQEQQVFYDYCEALREKGQGLNIIQYLSKRRKQGEKNENYYSRDFQNFMEEKYESKPEEKQMFTLSEYNIYMWENLSIHFTDKNIADYFENWVHAYESYSQMMGLQGEEEDISAFRIWKEQTYQYQGVKLKNEYFFETFILGYIQFLIRHKNFGVARICANDWREYGEYIGDYTAALVLKGEQFVSLGEYQKYLQFKKEQVNPFLEHIKNSAEITFNKKYAIQYTNKVYKDEGKIALKNYKKFIAAKQQEENERIKRLSKMAEALKKEVQEEEGEKFYLTIFNAYVAESSDEGIGISKGDYFAYKNQVLDRVDEKVIRMENEELEEEMQESMKEAEEEIKNSDIKKVEKGEGVIEFTVDIAEKYLHKLNEDSSEEEGEEMYCPCCKGDPENCKTSECEMTGYCIQCSY